MNTAYGLNDVHQITLHNDFINVVISLKYSYKIVYLSNI